ncbi:MAG TPA: S-layer protein domain-containing protein, partial [Methanosarcina sp.]|nr:S-layer protein domain-containing protein [Methanosarcina sp.]
VDDEIIDVGTGDSTWDVELDDIQGEDDVTVLKVHVNQVFQGAVDSIAQIEGIWLIDYANAMKIESDDEFGELNDVSINGDTLKISNEDTVTLTRDSDQAIGEGMSFKVADTPTSELRYYPFVEKTVGNETTNNTSNVGPSVSGNETIGNETEPSNITTETPEDVNATPETPEATTPEAPTEANTTKEENTPGFGVVLGLVGLLGVVYLVRRNN